MFKTCLENRIIYKQTGYKCYLCHYETQGNSFNLIVKHMEDKMHKAKLNNINKQMRSIESQKISTISEPQRRKIVENHITCDEKPGFLVCHICKYSISGLSNTLEHIKGSSHSFSLNKINNEKQKIQTNELKNINSTMINGNKVQKLPNLSKYQDNYHRTSRIQNTIVEIRYCSCCQTFLKNTKMLQGHVMMHLHKEFSLPTGLDIIKYSLIQKGTKFIMKCRLCNIFIETEENLSKHLETESHLNHLDFFQYLKEVISLDYLTTNINNTQEFSKFSVEKDISIALLCIVCDVSISGKSVDEHKRGRKHHVTLKSLEGTNKYKENETKFKMDVTNVYACFICEVSFSNKLNLFKHYNKYEHILKMSCFNIINKCSYIIFKKNNSNTAICTLCNTNLVNCRAAIEHISGKKHTAELELKSLKPKKDNSFFSSLCDEQLSLFKSAKPVKIDENMKVKSKDNATTKKSTTSKKMTKRNEFETSPEELVSLGFSMENLNSVSSAKSTSEEIEDALNDLVSLDLNKFEKQRLLNQRKPRVPNTELKNNSLNKKFFNYGKTFIKYCIDSGENNIYNIDPEKLDLMKLGISLTIPWKSERLCLPCGEAFPCDKQLLFEHLQHKEHIENLKGTIENDQEFEDYPEQFSDLKLALCYMHDESDDWVYCYACEMKIKNEDTEIHSHTRTSSHSAKDQFWKELSEKTFEEFSTYFTDIWYYAQVFICEVCSKKTFNFEIDFIIHLNTVKHQENVSKLSRNGTILEYGMCPVCTTCWYGNSNLYSRHCEDIFHKRFAKNGDFMVPNMTVNALDLLNNIKEKVNSLIQESDKVILEKDKESNLLNAIKDTVQCIYPNAEAYVFGSRLSNLGFPDSDVDIFLDCENVYYESTTKEQSQHYLSAVKRYFENKPNIWILDEVVLKTRVPIMKLRYIPTGLKCDISFINGLSVEKSSLVKYYCTAYPPCREMILYLKKWLVACQLAGSDSITTFAISWCVIFYLQCLGILPTVHEVIRMKNQSKIVDGWECGFLETISVASYDLQLEDQLAGFFTYFGGFDYKKNVVCPYTGQILKKNAFTTLHLIPREMTLYKHCVTKDDMNLFRYDSPMCIQDPIDLSQNMTKAVTKRQLRCFRQYCIESAKKIVETTKQ